MPDSLLRDVDGRGVATLTLNRPDLHNALDAALISTLHGALQEMQDDAAVRVVVLTGAGSSFCAGADLRHMQHMAHASEADNIGDAMALAQCLRALDELPKPVVARVNGPAFGGGIGLIACADIAIACRHASFRLSEVRLGLVAAVIAPYVVPAVGARGARRLMLTAAPFSAGDARDMGLLHDVTEDSALDSRIAEEVALLLQGGPQAQQTSKQLLRELTSDAARRDAGSEQTARLLARVRTGSEAQEGCEAFLKRRMPRWAH